MKKLFAAAAVAVALAAASPATSQILDPYYTYFGKTGFGTYYASLLSPSGNKVSFKFLTPIGDIPTWSTYNGAQGFDSLLFFDPFASP